MRVRLQPFAKRLLLISGLVGLSVGLSNIFVNIFIWKVDKSLVAIALYNLSIYLIMPVAFIIAGVVAKRLHSALPMRIGLLLHVCFYVITLFIGERAAVFPYLLGVLMGFASGFYWFSFNMLSLSYTSAGKRDMFFSLNGVVNALAGTIAPPISGYLISTEDKFGGLTGYHIIFGISLIFFIIAGWLSLGLTEVTLDRCFRFREAFSALSLRSWRMVMSAVAVYGLREGVFIFLIGLLFYIATGSELKLGNFLLMQGGISFASFYFVGKITTNQNRLRLLKYGAIGMTCAALLFLMPMTSRLILWYGASIALVLPLFLIPLQAYVFDGISNIEPDLTRRAEHVIMREVFGNGGRVIGILAFLTLVTFRMDKEAIASFAVGLGFVQLFSYILLKISHHASSETDSVV